ncbi:hypothetical protein FEM48_Zijuj03G0158500 [Ziziphus jujuba var. spinosa]|uniref:Uncharacterized protein n=1 Tax=Ziziphus jujuba var. spinosa TaxID=714518 RepID=A0A978VR79_ZIZJJ|nr:hypothetical protein FEM48_Zijuj03G0158500 [Ziziphus jujuba var. spinosa]
MNLLPFPLFLINREELKRLKVRNKQRRIEKIKGEKRTHLFVSDRISSTFLQLKGFEIFLPHRGLERREHHTSLNFMKNLQDPSSRSMIYKKLDFQPSCYVVAFP